MGGTSGGGGADDPRAPLEVPLRAGGPPQDAADLLARVVAAARGGCPVVVQLDGVDLGVVDVLARLALLRREGVRCSVVVPRPDDRVALDELLALVGLPGLPGLLGRTDRSCRVERLERQGVRQAEAGEQ